MKNHHMDLIRVTEAGAISAAKWVGRGDKESADKAATDAMRERLNEIDFFAEISIGEGVKDKSHGLFCGEWVGLGHFGKDPTLVEEWGAKRWVPNYSIAVDPIEGTTPTAKGGYEAMSVIAIGNNGSLYKTDCFYMDKIAVGPNIGKVSLDNSVLQNVKIVADSLNKSIEHVSVCVLDRPRTNELVEELRKIGCRIKFISDCDVTACIATCVPDSGVDMYWSIGGSPEAVISAAAMKCMGGYLECREVEFKNDKWVSLNFNGRVFTIEDLAGGEVMFAATGITDGKLLDGVRFTSNGPVTHSIGMRSGSGTVRRLVTQHGN